MICKKCGKSNDDSQIFCTACGARLSENVTTKPITIEKQNLKKNNAYKGYVIALGITLFIVVIGGGVLLWSKGIIGSSEDNKEENTVERNFTTEEETEDENVSSKFSTSDEAKKQSKFQKVEGSTLSYMDNYDSMTEDEKFSCTLRWLENQEPDYKLLDYKANEQIPNERNTSLEWDRTLFYTLEDVSVENPNDGQINMCNISKVQLKNKETQNLVECEVYKNSTTNEIQKIVTIEKQTDSNFYEVWEYYYQNGEVNFIFYSIRDVYTPTYATVDKCGERYYFNNYTLVKFRRIEVPLQVQDFLVSELNEYENNVVAGYDNLEIVGLTRAYNVYHTVQNTPIYGTLQGYVYDSNNAPITGAKITAHNNHYNQDVGQVETNQDGYYSIMVPADESGDYSLQARCGDDEPVDIYGVEVGQATTMINNENLYIPSSDQRDQSVDMEIMLCDAFNTQGNGDYYSNMKRLGYATLNIRKGVNNKKGEVIGTYQADGDGIVYATLPLGMYTGEIVADGYVDSYFTIAAKPDNTYMQSLTTPKLNENEIRIVLTWNDSPSDLDSHLFTPYQGDAGDMQHIGYYHRYDSYGNNLDVDDTTGYGPETITITNATAGNYKYYVSDYSNLSSGVSDSYAFSNSNATVRVYNKNGLQATFNVPVNQRGTIWEVFEIRNKKIIPIQRYYSYVEDKSWWSAY